MKEEGKFYFFKIEETLSRKGYIKASSNDEAKEKITDLYQNGEIVLDYSDFDGGEANVAVDIFPIAESDIKSFYNIYPL
jgi:hypothetical protein